MNIQNIMAKATAAVKFMYDRKAVVKRYEEYEKPNGADGMRLVVKYADVPCRLSTTGSAALNNTEQEAANEINYDLKLFLSSQYEVLAGDQLVVDGVSFESAAEPFVYVSHQEVVLNRKEFA